MKLMCSLATAPRAVIPVLFLPFLALGGCFGSKEESSDPYVDTTPGQVGLSSDAQVAPGTSALIPLPTVPPGVSATSASAPGPSPIAAGPTTSYTVQDGDYLWKIAADNGTTVSKIMTANNLTSDKILVGQTLVIPSGTSAAAPATTVPSATNPVTTGTNTIPGTTIPSTTSPAPAPAPSATIPATTPPPPPAPPTTTTPPVPTTTTTPPPSGGTTDFQLPPGLGFGTGNN